MKSSRFFLFIFIFLIFSISLSPSINAKKPSGDYILDPNVTILNEDNFEDGPFIVSAYKDKVKLNKDDIDWIAKVKKELDEPTVFWLEFSDDLKYDSDGKLKDPLSNITFRVEPSFIQNESLVSNQYYSVHSYDEVSFDSFKAKNNITDESTSPVYPVSNWDAFFELILSGEFPTWGNVQDYMSTPIAYDITFYGIIDDLDPEINYVYTSSSSLLNPKQVEATNLGVSLIYNGTDQTGYNSTVGNFTSWVFYNSTSTFWNTTMNIADSDGSAVTQDLCDADDNCVSYWNLDANYLDSKGSNDGTPTGTNNATGISSGAMSFDGDDAVYLGLNNLPTTTGSYSVWFKTSDVTTTQRVYEDIDNTGNNQKEFSIGSSNINFLGYDESTQFQLASPIVNDQWYHVIGTWEDNNANLYVNGELKATDTSVDMNAYTTFTHTLGVLNYTGSEQNYLTGQIDEVLIYNDTLTASEVEALYKAGLSQHANTNITLETRTATSYNVSDENGVSLWSMNAEPIVCDDLDACFTTTGAWITFASGYRDRRNYFTSEAANTVASFAFSVPTSGAYEVFALSDSNAIFATNAPYNVYHDDGNTTVLVDQRTIHSTSIGTYNFTAGTSYQVNLSAASWTGDFLAADAIIVGSIKDEFNNYNSSPPWANWSQDYGVVGGGYWFDGGTDDYIDIGTKINGTDLTVSAWIWVDFAYNIAGASYPPIIGDMDSGATTGWLLYYNEGDDKWKFLSTRSATDVSVQSPGITSDAALGRGKWQHIVATTNQTNGSLYIDGQIVGSALGSGGYIPSANNVRIGDNVDFGTTWKGNLDEIRIYNRSLSATEVQDLYELGDYYIEWNDWQDSGVMTDGVPKFSPGQGNFFQARPIFSTDDTSVSSYLLNHSIMATPPEGILPNITLNTPANGTTSIVADVNLTANISDASGIQNATLYIYNESGLYNKTFFDYSATQPLSISIGLVVTFIDGIYNWFYTATDIYNNIFTSENRTLTVSIPVPDTTRLDINFTDPTLADETTINDANIYVNISSSDNESQHMVIFNFNDTLSAWYRMEEGNGTFFADYLKENSGTCSDPAGGCPTFNSDGMWNGSYDFSGGNKSIFIDNALIDQDISNGFSIISWVYLTANDSNNIIYQRADSSVLLFIEPDMDVRFFMKNITGVIDSNVGDKEMEMNKWVHLTWVFTKDEHMKVYKDGELSIDQDRTGFGETLIKNNDNASYIATSDVGISVYNLSGSLDDMQFYNRELTSLEINATINATAYQYHNDFTLLGSGNYSLVGIAQDEAGNINTTGERNIHIYIEPSTPTSLLGVKFNTTTFTTSNIIYTEAQRYSFNTSAVNENLIILSSMNMKNAVGGTGDVNVWGQVRVDGNNISEENLGRLEWLGGNIDTASTGFLPINFTIAAAGSHNLSFYYKLVSVNPKAIEIFNWDISMGKLKTNLSTLVNGSVNQFTTTFSDTTFTTIQTFDVLRNYPSKSYYTTKLNINASDATEVACRLEEGEDLSSTTVSYLSDLDDQGDFVVTWLEEDEAGTHQVNLSCASIAGETVSVSGKFLDFGLTDVENNTISGNSSSNLLTNYTTNITLGAGTHEISNHTQLIADNGDSMFISAVASFSSTTGEQTPVFFINSSLGSCSTTKDRYVSGNNAREMFIYYMCKDSPSLGDVHNVTLSVTVPAGESIVLFDESLVSFETKAFDTSTINTRPVVTILQPDINEVILGIYQTNYTITDPQLNTYLINVTLSNSTNTTYLGINLLTGNNTLTFDTRLYKNGWYNFSVNATENNTAEFLSGQQIHAVYINNSQGTLNLTSPSGEFSDETDIGLNFTTTVGQFTCYYSLNGAANISVPCSGFSTNTTFNSSTEGMNDFVLSVETGAGWLYNITVFDVNTQNSTLLIFPTESEYEDNEAVTITSYCRFTNGTVCTSDIACRLTSHYPNGSLLVENVFMDWAAGGVYTYSIGYTNGTELSAQGAYSSVVSCYDGYDNDQSFTWWILTEENQYVFLYSLLFLTSILLIIFGEWKKQWPLKYMGGMLMAFIGVWLFMYGIPGYSLSYLGSGDSDAWISWVSWIIIGFGTLYFFKSVYEDAMGGDD